MPSPPERSAFSIVKNSDLSTHRNEHAPDADGNSGQKSTSMRFAQTPAQRFIEHAKRLPSMEQLPARYDAAITGTPALLGFGLGVTFNQLLAYVHKRDIRDPCEPDHPIISPMVAWSMIIKPLKSKVLGLRLFYRTPYSLEYDGLIALYSNHSFRRYQYHDASEKRIIEIIREELEIDSTPMWYWDVDYDSWF